MRIRSRFNCQVIIVLSQHYVNDTLPFFVHVECILPSFCATLSGRGEGWVGSDGEEGDGGGGGCVYVCVWGRWGRGGANLETCVMVTTGHRGV